VHDQNTPGLRHSPRPDDSFAYDEGLMNVLNKFQRFPREYNCAFTRSEERRTGV
jgi:hypothetical protein